MMEYGKLDPGPQPIGREASKAQRTYQRMTLHTRQPSGGFSLGLTSITRFDDGEHNTGIALGVLKLAAGQHREMSYPPHHHRQPEIYDDRFPQLQGFGLAQLGHEVDFVRNRDTVKILMLGLDAPLIAPEERFAVAAAQPLCRGFAVGQSAVSSAARGWLSSTLGDREAREESSDTCLRPVTVWESGKRRAATPATRPL
jgi:hypothetical protein